MRIKATVIAASAAVMLGLFTTKAQQPAPGQAEPTFRTGINYVELPVRVTDRKGNFVRDLTRADFDVSGVSPRFGSGAPAINLADVSAMLPTYTRPVLA